MTAKLKQYLTLLKVLYIKPPAILMFRSTAIYFPFKITMNYQGLSVMKFNFFKLIKATAQFSLVTPCECSDSVMLCSFFGGIVAYLLLIYNLFSECLKMM